MARRGPWGAWAALLAVGCGPDPSDQPGELGNGLFAWICATGADPACREAGEAAEPFPEVVAVGSQFELMYRGNGGDYHQPQAGSTHLRAEWPAGRFTALEPGWASVVVYRRGFLLDYLHLDLREVERFQMSTTGLGSSGLAIGERARIQVNPICGEQVCAGSLPYVWSVDDEGVLALLGEPGPDNQVRVEARRPGTTVVRVTDGRSEGSVEIDVYDAQPIPTGETGEPGTDGITDDIPGDTGITVDTGEDTGALVDTGLEGDTAGDTAGDTGLDTGVSP